MTIAELKIALLVALNKLSYDEITDNEVDLAYLLVQDDDIQKRLNDEIAKK